MATTEDLKRLILMVGTELLSEEQMGLILDLNETDFDAAAAQVWEIRAGKYHGLVNISESGSSRSMGDLHKNALAMAAMYRAKEVAVTPEASSSKSGTRRIVRE